MLNILKNKLPWPLVRAHICILAMSMNVNNFILVPRDGFRYGGLSYLLIFTSFSILVALPICMLQLCIGQLSQQDAVGVWRAVPFFKGVGYMKLLTSFLGSIWTVTYTAIVGMYFLNTLRSSIPFRECKEYNITATGVENNITASECLDKTFMAPVREHPEFFILVGIIVVILWSVSPFLLYSPVRYMKRIFYITGPTLLILAITILLSIGVTETIEEITNVDDWKNLLHPHIWFSALVQALLSSHIGTGFLISAADNIFASTNVQWISITLILSNVIAGWAGIIFWFSIAGSGAKENTVFSVAIALYEVVETNQIMDVWPLVTYATLFLSGFVSMVIFLYPVYDRLRRMIGDSWRKFTVIVTIIGLMTSLTILAGGRLAIEITVDVVISILITVATLFEIVAFIFIYGWKSLLMDIEFLTGVKLTKYWYIGWRLVAIIILPFLVWWTVTMFLFPPDWSLLSFEVWIITTFVIVVFILISFAVFSIVRQVQYDILLKIKSSFKPSRHWGPRDPITHYYWLARREEYQLNDTPGSMSPTRYSAWQLGQLTGGPAFVSIASTENKTSTDWPDVKTDIKRRANSDDWLYTRFRKKAATYFGIENRQRSRSVDHFHGNLAPVKLDTSMDKKFFDYNMRSRNEVIDVICYIKRPKQSLSASSQSQNDFNRNESQETINDSRNFCNSMDFMVKNIENKRKVDEEGVTTF